LIDVVEPYFNENHEDAEKELGYASHPIQDMAGHSDDYVRYSRRVSLVTKKDWPIYMAIPWVGRPVWNHGWVNNTDTGADKFATEIVKDGIRYYHWDDVIWARDLTYDILGRFYKEYNNLM